MQMLFLVVVSNLAVMYCCELCVIGDLTSVNLAVHNPVITSLHTTHLFGGTQQQQTAATRVDA